MSDYRLRLLADGGRAVAEKSAGPSSTPGARRAAEARLRHEAAMLEVAAHPGVVTLDGVRDEPDGVVVRTGLVPGRSLADVAAGELTVEEVAALSIALATTVADLHERGLVHGRLHEPSHVLLPPVGPPVICGFGDARAGPAPAPADAAAVDVAAVGGLLLNLLGDTPAEGVEAVTANALASLARRALGAGASRPTARSLAAGLRDAVPDAGRPGAGAEVVGERPTAGFRHLRLVRAAASGVGGLAILTMALLALGGGDDRDALAPTEPPPGRASSTTDTTRPTRPRASPLPRDGDAPVVVAAGRRFQVGEPGDVVLVADWPCPGAPVAVVVRPHTGAVTVFDRWAEPGEVLAGRHLTRVRGAVTTATAATTAGPGCGALELRHADGTTSVVELDAAPG